MLFEPLEKRSLLSAAPNFGVGTFAMDSASDTGVPYQAPTFTDNITKIATPVLDGTVHGYTLGDPISVQVYLDTQGTGNFSPSDKLLGTVTVANTSIDNAAWSFLSPNLNQQGLATDGLRTLFAVAVDGADGTTSPAATTQIFLDSSGPRITAITYHATGQSIFSTATPPSNTTQIDIQFTDAAIRPADPTSFYGTYAPAQNTAKNSAVNEVLADITTNYQLVGGHTGAVAIASASFTDTTGVRPGPGVSLVTLTFAKPLASDQYTITVSNAITNDAGAPLQSTGNSTPNGSLSGSFAIQGGVSLAVQLTTGVQFGNLTNLAASTTTVKPFYTASDTVFTGNFPAANGAADGFSKLAAYGISNGKYRFLFQSDTTGGVTSVVSPVQVMGLPVAGHFYASASKGDQVAIFTGSVWYILSSDLTSVEQVVRWKPQSGLPVVGDFDGKGESDLATWKNGMLTISYASTGFSQIVQQPIALNFTGVRTRPVAVDIEGDRIDDLGFWVPDNGLPSTKKPADWYFILSDGKSLAEQTTYNVVHYQFGSSVGLPLTGMFAATTTSGVYATVATAPAQVAPPPSSSAPVGAPLIASAAATLTAAQRGAPSLSPPATLAAMLVDSADAPISLAAEASPTTSTGTKLTAGPTIQFVRIL